MSYPSVSPVSSHRQAQSSGTKVLGEKGREGIAHRHSHHHHNYPHTTIVTTFIITIIIVIAGVVVVAAVVVMVVVVIGACYVPGTVFQASYIY